MRSFVKERQLICGQLDFVVLPDRKQINSFYAVLSSRLTTSFAIGLARLFQQRFM